MRGGMTLLLGAAAAATAGCAAKPGQIEVRSLSDPATKLGTGNERIAEARGQLALGNVGLAIEGFHVALREQPDSIEAMGGLASCYDSMGRSDLSRQYYEQALAIAPHNPALLNAFAASLEGQGKIAEAMGVRSEAALASRPSAPAVSAPPAKLADLTPPAPAATVTVALAEASEPPVPVPAPETPATPVPVAAAPVAPAPVAVPAPSVVAAITLPAAKAPNVPPPVVPAPKAVEVAAAPPAQTVTISLPPARPATPPVAAVAVAMPVEPMPAIPPTPALPAMDAVTTGPRLQRLSMGEVALLTTGEPAWQSTVRARSAPSTAVRWVALNDAAPRPNIRLLNAARSPGLAARTRAYLMARGWRKIEIGDANEVRASSLVQFPQSRRTTGRSLAAQFGFRPGMSQQGEEIVVYLGRDAAAARAALARG